MHRFALANPAICANIGPMMRNPRHSETNAQRLLGLIAVFALATPFSFGDSDDLNKARAAYGKHRDGLESQLERETDALEKQYLDSLRGAEKNAVDEGQLDRLLAIRAEIAELEGEPAAAAPADALVKVARLRYQQRRDELRTQFEAKERRLRQEYRRVLEQLKTQYTREEKIEQAVEIREMIARMDRVPLHRSLLAETSPRTPDTVTPPPPPAAVPGPPAARTGLPPRLVHDTLLYLSFERIGETAFVDDGPRRVTCLRKGGASLGPGRRGQALVLKEKGDYIDIVPFRLAGEFTLGLWVHYDRNSPYGHTLKMADGKQAEISAYTEANGRDMSFAVSGNGWDITRLTCRDLCEVNTWMHLLITCDARGAVRVYKNGKLVTQAARKTGISPQPRRHVRVGRDFNEKGAVSHYGLYGKIDELIVLSRALRPDEVPEFVRWFGDAPVP